jgi:hypothetical protein
MLRYLDKQRFLLARCSLICTFRYVVCCSWYLTGLDLFRSSALCVFLQIPTRIVYINGFKGIRKAIDNSQFMQNVDNTSNPTLFRLLAAITPGLCMTPVSSLLEAFNAGHMNKEPLTKRWTRGIAPRSCREVIFGVGLNQLSDFCEERADFISNKFMRNAVASMTAGVIAGYVTVAMLAEPNFANDPSFNSDT